MCPIHLYFACLIISRKKNTKERKKQWQKSSAFFFSKVFVIVVAHIEVKGMDTVSLGDVKAIVLS